jgi:sugar phosphate isomerase/epimerase
MMWSVPRMWEGQTVAVLASGFSMSQAVADQVHAAGISAIAINNTYRLAPWAYMLYAADAAWWRENPQAWDFKGLKVSVEEFKGVLRLQASGPTGFDPDPRRVRTGGNSGYQAVHIAAHAGAARVLLCGFNMGGDHWHPEHAAPLRETPREIYATWIQRLEGLADTLKLRGIEVLNCTPDSAIKGIPTADLAFALEDCHASY